MEKSHEEYVACYRKACLKELKAQELMLKEMVMPAMPKNTSKENINTWIKAITKHSNDIKKHAINIRAIKCKFDKCRKGALAEMEVVHKLLRSGCKTGSKPICKKADKVKEWLKTPSKITPDNFVWVETTTVR